MMWIDGEYFENPVDSAKSKKAFELFKLETIIKTTYCNYMIVAGQPLFPLRYDNGGIVYPKTINEETA
jgi:hypothetical protein